MDWSNKVLLITGASSGIGRGLALELARRGAKLGLVARRRELLQDLVSEISSGPGRNDAVGHRNPGDDERIADGVVAVGEK